MEENKEVNELEIGFLSYNGLNKPALVFGVPLMIFVSLLASILFIALPVFYYVHKYLAYFIVCVDLLIFFIMKVISENDPNAGYVWILKIKGFIRFKLKNILAVRGSR